MGRASTVGIRLRGPSWGQADAGEAGPGSGPCSAPSLRCPPALGLEAGGRGQVGAEEGSQTCICVCPTGWAQGSSVQSRSAFGGEAGPSRQEPGDPSAPLCLVSVSRAAQRQEA